MKIRLLYADHDERQADPAPAGWEELVSEAGIGEVAGAMARNDVALAQACRKALAHPLATATEVAYRQDAIRDALAHPAAVRHLFALAQGEATRSPATHPEMGYAELAETAAQYRSAFEELSGIARELRGSAKSVAFRRFCDEAAALADQEYLRRFDGFLKELSHTRSALMSVRLDPSGPGSRYEARCYPRRTDWLRWKVSGAVSSEVDEAVQRRDRAARIARAQESLRPALWSMLAAMGTFFEVLRDEAGFYAGCANLVETLEEEGTPWCLPAAEDVIAGGSARRMARKLSFIGEHGAEPVLDEAEGKDVSLWIASGQRQAGSLLLRAWAQAQAMAEAGLPVAAEELSVPMRTSAVFIPASASDAAQAEAELGKASAGIGQLRRGSLLLWEDPFRSLTQKEAAALLGEILPVLAASGVETMLSTGNVLVSARNLAHRGVFHLRAEKTEDGFQAVKGRPKPDEGLAEAFEDVFGEKIDEAFGLGRGGKEA